MPATGGRDPRPRALPGLLSRGANQLQSHPVPSQLGEDERRAMIPDGRGSFYMAIGLRSTPE